MHAMMCVAPPQQTDSHSKPTLLNLTTLCGVAGGATCGRTGAALGRGGGEALLAPPPVAWPCPWVPSSVLIDLIRSSAGSESSRLARARAAQLKMVNICVGVSSVRKHTGSHSTCHTFVRTRWAFGYLQMLMCSESKLGCMDIAALLTKIGFPQCSHRFSLELEFKFLIFVEFEGHECHVCKLVAKELAHGVVFLLFLRYLLRCLCSCIAMAHRCAMLCFCFQVRARGVVAF